MHRLNNSDNEKIKKLVDDHPAGYAFAGKFYSDESIYRTDMEYVWRRGWLFVGFTFEIPEPGNYFTFEVGDDSLIVIRGNEGEVNALYNTCRHRGTLICNEAKGTAQKLVCPYHGWVYDRDGSLLSNRGMQEGLDYSELSLHKATVKLMGGMIYLTLSDSPPDFNEAYDLMITQIRPQGLEAAKIAKSLDYLVEANWKLVWDNNRECWHCNVNHPQYIKANYDNYDMDDTPAAVQHKMDAITARSEEKFKAVGLAPTILNTGLACFPDPDNKIWYSANRTSMKEGYVSESLDGKRVAPLMGVYQDEDVGVMRIRTMPNMWCHGSCDHAVITRLLPVGPKQTAVRTSWLVEKDAVEGRDYELEKLMPFWQLTGEQDWDLCTRAQRGINSSRYTPGPLSTNKEYNVDRFHRWYLDQLIG